jgi:glucose/mannose transport system permease protein
MLVAAYVIITSALSGSTGAPNFFLAFPDAPSLSLSAASRPEP